MKKRALVVAVGLALFLPAIAGAEDAVPAPAPAAPAAPAPTTAAAPVAPPAPDCAAKATERKLAGAALNSFLKKCEQDTALKTCLAAAAEKKLVGAARVSFAKKCAKDATTKPPEEKAQ